MTNSLVNKTGKHKNGMTRRHRKQMIFIFTLMLFPIVQWLIFWLYPNATNLVLPFTMYDPFEDKIVSDGFNNLLTEFKKVFSVPATRNAFLNSWRALPINFIILPISVIVGYAFSKHVPGERIFRILFFIPSIISTVTLVLCFKYIFEYAPSADLTGPGAVLLHKLGIDWHGWNMEYPKQVWTMIYIYCIWAGFSVNVIMISSAMQRIPEALVESAKLDGTGFWRELWSIRIPLIMPTISVFIINSIMCVTSFFLVPMTFMTTKGPQGIFDTFPWLMLRHVEENGLDPSTMIAVSTLGFILMIFLTPIILVTKAVTDKITPDVSF